MLRRIRRRLLGLVLAGACIPLLALALYVTADLTGVLDRDEPRAPVALVVLASSAATTAAVAWILGSWLGRRRQRRLAALTKAAGRIGREHLAPPVAKPTGDELDALERAMQRSASAIRRSLERLRTAAEIDRRILTSKAIGPVLDFLLERFDRFVDCSFAGIALADFENELVLTFHSADLVRHETHGVKRIQLPAELHARLAALDTPLSIDPGDPLYRELLPDEARNLAELRLIAVTRANKLLGFLALGGCRGAEAETAAVLGELKERLALAFSQAEREQTLFVQAHFDPLTSLPNRCLSIDRLEQELSRAERSHTQLGLLFIDLDRFKSINDSLGHAAGDELLKVVAQRLSECFRDADTVARLGGDEFIVLLPDITDPKAAGELADRIARAFEEPIMLRGSAIYTSASVGIAVYPMDGRGAEQLLCNADAAMYRAKQSGSGGKAYFTEELNVSARRRVRLEAELREIIRDEELELAFQPQISLQDGSLTGVEVLLRWPGHRVAPDEFVPLAEDTGLIHDIGFWVLDTACKSMLELGDRVPRLAINVSPAQLRDGHFAERVLATLARHGLATSRLEFEITESLFVDPDAETRKVLDKLAEAGIGLTLDDFATGTSMLRALPEYPINQLKVDRSFVAAMTGSARDRLLVETVVRLAHGLDLPVVAEGIERHEQLKLARQLGCDQGQGFLFSHPISLEQLRHFLAGQATRPRAEAGS